MRAIILAGGLGTRLAPYTNVFPKPLMPVGDMPILEIIIRQLARQGVTHVTMAVGHLAGLIQTFFGDGSKHGVTIDYHLEEAPLGTAGALAFIEGIEDDVLVMNGDILANIDYASMADYHKRNQAAATIAAFNKTIQLSLGVLQMKEGGNIAGYLEKPLISNTVSMGIYMLSQETLTYIQKGERLDFPDLIRRLIAAKRKVIAYEFKGKWLDIGNREDFEEANRLFMNDKAAFLDF